MRPFRLDIDAFHRCPYHLPIDVGKEVRAGEAGSRRAGGEHLEKSSVLLFRLDPSSGTPTYAQLVQQVEHALRLGYLQLGDRLPKVREVVSALAINPNTVLKAYKELEGKGLVVGRPGQGTFVVGSLEQVDLAKLHAVRRSLLGWFAQASAAGLDEHGVVALFSTTLRDFLDQGGDGENRTGAAGRGSSGGDRQETA